MWNHNLDSTSIFASPICDDASNLFVATLGGNLYCLNALTGLLQWSVKLGKPCFGTPTVSNSKSQVFVGTCEGLFYSYSFDGTMV